eukprot:m.22589 g.22589  ORF g.22589 m.22589 type:complete len:493 (+) comp11272_c0_seq2:1427-2905(+)
MSLAEFNAYRRANLLVVVSDKHSSRWSQESIDTAFQYGVVLVYLEQHTTHVSQPLDQVFALPKQILCKLIDKWRREHGGKDPTWTEYRPLLVHALRVWASRNDSRAKAFSLCGYRTDSFDPSLMRTPPPKASHQDVNLSLGFEEPFDEWTSKQTPAELKHNQWAAHNEIARLQAVAAKDVGALSTAIMNEQARSLSNAHVEKVSKRSLLVLPTGASTSSHVQCYTRNLAAKQQVTNMEQAAKSKVSDVHYQLVETVLEQALSTTHEHCAKLQETLSSMKEKSRKLQKKELVMCLAVVLPGQQAKGKNEELVERLKLAVQLQGPVDASETTPPHLSPIASLETIKAECAALEEELMAINTGQCSDYESTVPRFRNWTWTEHDLAEAVALQREVEATPRQLEWQRNHWARITAVEVTPEPDLPMVTFSKQLAQPVDRHRENLLSRVAEPKVSGTYADRKPSVRPEIPPAPVFELAAGPLMLDLPTGDDDDEPME